MFRAYRPTAPEAVIEELVTARMNRARILPHGPKLVFRATAWAAFVENLKDETA